VHRAQGVDIRTGVVVSGFIPGEDGKSVGGVECGEGDAIPCDLVIIGIGLIPNVELAEEAGLVVDNGIVVDLEGRTTDPHIFAVGDCTTHQSHGFLDRKLRLESVPNALEQARTVAAAITGKPLPPVTPPWFWSDQYELKLQMVGISDGYDEVVVRGEPENSSFIAFYLKEGRILSADSVNRLADFMVAKRLVAAKRVIPAAELSDTAKPLKALL
jgi:3-phenylpropionate/trans-cinnamate dioxygenase ferredoxin reductase subunit